MMQTRGMKYVVTSVYVLSASCFDTRYLRRSYIKRSMTLIEVI